MAEMQLVDGGMRWDKSSVGAEKCKNPRKLGGSMDKISFSV